MVARECAKASIERGDFRFTRREVREATGWSNTQLRLHLQRLVELEYVLVHRGARGQGFVYELLYDGGGKDGSPFLLGLLDVDALAHEYDATLSRGRSPAGFGRRFGVLFGPNSGGGRSEKASRAEFP